MVPRRCSDSGRYGSSDPVCGPPVSVMPRTLGARSGEGRPGIGRERLEQRAAAHGAQVAAGEGRVFG